jgi:hypothetical protein
MKFSLFSTSENGCVMVIVYEIFNTGYGKSSRFTPGLTRSLWGRTTTHRADIFHRR